MVCKHANCDRMDSDRATEVRDRLRELLSKAWKCGQGAGKWAPEARSDG